MKNCLIFYSLLCLVNNWNKHNSNLSIYNYNKTYYNHRFYFSSFPYKYRILPFSTYNEVALIPLAFPYTSFDI